MSSDLSQSPAAEPSLGSAPFADFVVVNRGPVSYALLLIGLIGLACGIYFFAKVVKAGKETAGKDDTPTVTVANPNRAEQIIGGIGGLMVMVVGLGVGTSLLVAPPRPTWAARRYDARITILLAGGLLGLSFMIIGLALLIIWFGSLMQWLDEGKRSEAKYVLAPILTILLGGGLAFLAAQPARDEERNNSLIRRLVYGTNLTLGVLLLSLLLLVGNVFAALRIPNRLDTTESGFYTLSDTTKELINSLDKPITAYSTLSDVEDGEGERLVRDARSLLSACQEVNPAKFKVRFLSPSLNRDEISRLNAKFPQFDKNDLGILLVTGEDESKAAFIRASELFTQEFEGRSPTVVFQGEGRLVREILFLNESGSSKPIIYVTQGARELELTTPAPGAKPTSGRSAAQLRATLEKGNIEVRPLEIDLASPKVPDDATIVVVPDPQVALAKEQVDAIRKFMVEPRPNGKKGKLIMMTSPYPVPGGTTVSDTGLEGVLAEFGVSLSKEYLLNQPADVASYTDAVVGVNPDLADARNPVALGFADRMLILPNAREVNPAAQTGPGLSIEPLFLTVSGRLTWLEPDYPANASRLWQDLIKTRELQVSRRLSRQPRSVAVLVSEPPAPGAKGASPVGRVAVYGSGTFFADPSGRGARNAQVPAELFANTVDWLRDRPAAAAVANKTYGRYTPKADPDEVRILFLPVGVTLLAVLALGFGVWVFRRK